MSMPPPPLPFVPHAPGQFFLSVNWMPVGAVIAFAGRVDSAPSDSPSAYHTNVEATGWMVCDGRLLKAGQYPELFAALGFLYKQQGDPEEQQGEKVFRIPDYQGYFLRGTDREKARDKDERQLGDGTTNQGVGSLQADALQTHEHNYTMPEAPSGSYKPGGEPVVQQTKDSLTTGDPQTNPQSPGGTVKVSQYETRPCNACVHYLIRYVSAVWQ